MASRAWINAFFFRVSAMVPSNETMVLSVKQRVLTITLKPSSSTTTRGFIDYVAITATGSNEELGKIAYWFA